MSDELKAAEEAYNTAGANLRRLYEERLSKLAGGGAPPENTWPELAAKEVERISTDIKNSKPSRKTLASRKLQGRYLAFARALGVKDRAKLSKLAKGGDRESAILAMEKELRARERAKKAKAKEKGERSMQDAANKRMAARKLEASKRSRNTNRRVSRAAKRILASIGVPSVVPDATLANDAGAGDIQ